MNYKNSRPYLDLRPLLLHETYSFRLSRAMSNKVIPFVQNARRGRPEISLARASN